MVSMFPKGKGLKARNIDIRLANGKRPRISLGKLNETPALRIAGMVKRLETCARTGEPLDAPTAKWVKGLYDSDPKLAKRLAECGLIVGRRSFTLGQAVSEYLSDQTRLAESTQTQKRLALRYLVDYLGKDKAVRDITEGDAERHRNQLVEVRGLDPASTTRRSCGRCKEFFAWAIRNRLIDRNPFVVVKVTVQANPEKHVFVEQEWINRVLDACPDAEWRVIVALARYGGLRPGEITRVRWCDIDWSDEDGRVTIWSPKTRNSGKPLRVIPMFPEIRKALGEAFDAAPEGAIRVAESYHEGANIRTQFDKIITRAGVVPWVKPYTNMRSTRATELLDAGHPLKAVCQWIGHTEAVALKHYHQVTKRHYQAASRVSEKPKETSQNVSGSETSAKTSALDRVPSLTSADLSAPLLTAECHSDLKTLLFPLVYATTVLSGPQQIAQQGLEP